MLESILNIVKSVLSWVIALLPDSPFTMLSNTPVAQYLGYVNWFMPISFFMSATEAWLTAIAIYYAVSAIMRWAKAIT